ncbi:chemotaxis protein [Texcoconibacillus texcoconensis]|uniref:Two-component system chemotaxis response regulator CheV n=1 Tax=Texcoconibacillus texcoconensis TaxID=1095777 RepID=A0A840QT97_9BACI|nr:chemotaxis protein [Texcoconibacillus texcoconensis]MBB5174497.1 two-component system chemotaxis response regulator CheV [Texcoconibacillus texcoconensis]
MSEEDQGILLESGTNELEVIMFSIGSSTFGINVIKVREIIQPVDVTPMPESHPNVKGIIRLRDEVIPVIDLAKAIGFSSTERSGQDKYIVAELNQIKVAFHVDSVSRIHRISWEQIEKPTKLSQGLKAMTIGVIKMKEDMVLLLDYEKIVVDISPEAGIHSERLTSLGERERSHKKVTVVEDSPILRQLLRDTLEEAGYGQLTFYENGKEAWDTLESFSHQGTLDQNVDMVITDIEMPQMDGHHLTKRIKDHKEMRKLPTVIFSSLITEDLYHKGKKVGADAQVSKPEIDRLVETMDQLLAD